MRALQTPELYRIAWCSLDTLGRVESSQPLETAWSDPSSLQAEVPTDQRRSGRSQSGRRRSGTAAADTPCRRARYCGSTPSDGAWAAVAAATVGLHGWPQGRSITAGPRARTGGSAAATCSTATGPRDYDP